MSYFPKHVLPAVNCTCETGLNEYFLHSQYELFQFQCIQFLQTAFGIEMHKIFLLFKCINNIGNAVLDSGTLYTKDRNKGI